MWWISLVQHVEIPPPVLCQGDILDCLNEHVLNHAQAIRDELADFRRDCSFFLLVISLGMVVCITIMLKNYQNHTYDLIELQKMMVGLGIRLGRIKTELEQAKDTIVIGKTHDKE